MTYISIIIGVSFAIILYSLFREINKNDIINQEARAYKHIAEQTEKLYDEIKKKAQELHEEKIRREQAMLTVQAHYCASDSDYNKYSTEAAMVKSIKSKLAMTLANDLIKNIGDPDVSENAIGNKVFSYRVKIDKNEGNQ